jgi:hypothetical protein
MMADRTDSGTAPECAVIPDMPPADEGWDALRRSIMDLEVPVLELREGIDALMLLKIGDERGDSTAAGEA